MFQRLGKVAYKKYYLDNTLKIHNIILFYLQILWLGAYYVHSRSW